MFATVCALASLHALRSEVFPLEKYVIARHLKIGHADGDDVGEPITRVRWGYPWLAAAGERCHPAFHQMLDEDQRRRPQYTRGVMEVLIRQTCDRSTFLPTALQLALETDLEVQPSPDAQRLAVKLIGQIGTADHVEKLLPVLHAARNAEVFTQVLACVVELGDSRHAGQLRAELNAPRPKLPPLTVHHTKQLLAAVEALQAKPPPEPPKK